jgi:hypothetical protein
VGWRVALSFLGVNLPFTNRGKWAIFCSLEGKVFEKIALTLHEIFVQIFGDVVLRCGRWG